MILPCSPFRARQRGLTLLELLVVVTILAAVAGIAFGYQSSVQKRMANDLDKVQVAELVRALRRFHQDTGFYPRQGPFALSTAGGAVKAPDECTGTCLANFDAAFDSPANLQQLFVRPTYDDAASAHPLAWLVKNSSVTPAGPEAVDEPRRWRGPYLQTAAAGALYVFVGNEFGFSGEDDPAAGTLLPVIGLADPRSMAAGNCSAAQPFCWFVLNADGTTTSAAAVHRAAPYLLILDDAHPRVVGLGLDGRYGGLNASDACLPATGSDDLVVCL